MRNTFFILLVLLIARLIPCSAQISVVTHAGDTLRGDRNGEAKIARFDQPAGILIKPDGTMLISDKMNSSIRKLSGGMVTKFTGNGQGYEDGDKLLARFNRPGGIVQDKNGDIYVVDTWNNVIRVIDFLGKVKTLAFTDSRFSLSYPSDIAIDDSLNVYIADFGNHRIVKVFPGGKTLVLAGGQQGYADGKGTNAQFNFPKGICMGDSGSLIVADSWNHRIRKVRQNGVVITIAGDGIASFADGRASEASFHYPADVARDARGNIYIADDENHAIRVLYKEGDVQTLAGRGYDGTVNGSNSKAHFCNPRCITLDKAGNVYVCDQGKNRIRKIVIGSSSSVAKKPSGKKKK